MIKKLFWMVVLLAVTACTVFLGDGFNFPFLDPTPTPIVCENCTLEPTLPVESVTPVPTMIGTITEIPPTSTLETTSTAEVTATFSPTYTATSTMVNTATLIPATSTLVPPTATPTKVPPTATPTKVPPTATATSTSIPPTATTVPTNTPTAITILYNVQPATPIFMSNFVHTTEACAWQGVAGQIFSKTGTPVTNYIVKITGSYNGKVVNLIGITGMVAGNPYGPGSFEIVLGNTALDSIDLLNIQVFDPQAKPVTNPLSFSTSSACNKNLVVINFVEK